MKKEHIYVVIDSEEKQKRAIKILIDSGENIGDTTFNERYKYLRFDTSNEWNTFSFVWTSKTEINLDQLNQLLSPKQEVKMQLDALKLIAESYGFELVEKKREIKVGDFGKFETKDTPYSAFGFLREIDEYGCFTEDVKGVCNIWANFRHLTDYEKLQIAKNW
jgi:hypothetical protein